MGELTTFMRSSLDGLLAHSLIRLPDGLLACLDGLLAHSLTRWLACSLVGLPAWLASLACQLDLPAWLASLACQLGLQVGGKIEGRPRKPDKTTPGEPSMMRREAMF